MNMANIIKLEATKSRIKMFRLTTKHLLTVVYLVLLLLPFTLAESLGMLFEGLYSSVLGAINLIGMMAFFVQFPLAGRTKNIPLFSNIDWSIEKHKQFGKYLGIFFFLHPFLILAPKLLLSLADFQRSFESVLTSDHLLPGLIAWVVMAVWVLSAIYKDKLNMRYETWRLLHVIGFVIITTLATFHITSVGSHGQYNQAFNSVWWGLYSLSMLMVIYNYFIKPRAIQAQPFAISSIEKISDCDWQLEIESPQPFAYQAGQFVWINTSHSAYNLEQHPFSIASVDKSGRKLSFIIRELGDYTASLNQLQLGQTVFVDGPYGSMSLEQTRTLQGITLIAGGAGIAPMMSLLRELAKQNDTRPIRLIYGNQSLQRMVCIDELLAFESSMVDFKLQLSCEFVESDELSVNKQKLSDHIQQGFITKAQIDNSIGSGKYQQWAVYFCGPEAMTVATIKNLKQLGITSNNVHFEQLSF